MATTNQTKNQNYYYDYEGNEERNEGRVQNENEGNKISFFYSNDVTHLFRMLRYISDDFTEEEIKEIIDLFEENFRVQLEYPSLYPNVQLFKNEVHLDLCNDEELKEKIFNKIIPKYIEKLYLAHPKKL
jgi:hypothetical protein